MLTFNEGKYDDIKEVVKGSKIMEEYRKDAEEAAEIQELWERLAYDREAEQKALYQAELKRREEFGIKQKEKEAAIAFYKKGVSKEIICDALNIDSQQLEDILAENKDNTEK